MGHAAELDENVDPGFQTQYKGSSYMKSLKTVVEDYFKRSYAQQLCGFEVVGIVETFIKSNRERKCQSTPRDVASRVCNLLLREGFVRPLNGFDVEFVDDLKTLYRLGTPDESQGVVILSKDLRSRETSREREKPQRRSSISRILQSPMLRRGSVSRSSKTTLSSSSASSSKSREDMELLDDEARLFEFALSKLLILVDISHIEELVDMQEHCGDELKEGSTERATHLLTSILSRMGLWADEEEGADVETAFLLSRHRRAKLLQSYFKSVSAMCPRMQISEDRSLDETDQVEQWGRTALRAVSDRLDSITRNGYSPLVPKEFAKGVAAVGQLREKKMREALIYLCGMIPYKLRKELLLTLEFLHQCQSTDLFFSLNDSRAARRDADLSDNKQHAVDTLRTFILPQIGIDLERQRRLICTLVDMRSELKEAVAALRSEALSRCSPVPARFCEPAAPEENATDAALADLLVTIIASPNLSQQEKYKKLQLFQTQHPRAYAIYIRRA